MSDEPLPPDGSVGEAEEPASHALGVDFYRWLNQQFQAKPGRSVLKVEVFHVGASMTPVRKWDSSELEGGPQPLIAEIQDAADQDAQPMDGLQTYSCVVTFTDSRKHDPMRRLFRAMGGQSARGGVHVGSEGPNASGLVVQAMRHTNAAYEQLTRNNAIVFGALGGALERAEARAARAEERQLELIGLHSEMLRKKGEQDFELEGKRDLRKVQNSVLEEAGKALLPALAPLIEGLGTKLMGAAPTPPQPPPTGVPAPQAIPPQVEEVLGSLTEFIKTLDQEAAAALIASLPNGEQKQKLMDLFLTIDRVRGVDAPPKTEG